MSRFAEAISQATCTALAPILTDLIGLYQKYTSDGTENSIEKDFKSSSWRPFKCSLRVDLSRDQVGYVFGMAGRQVTEPPYLARLDNELILLLHQANAHNVTLVVELVFTVQERYNLSGVKLVRKSSSNLRSS